MWNLLNNREFVSTNLLSSDDISIIDCNGAELIAMKVPRADRSERPVFTHGNPRNAYRRNEDGDYKCSPEEITAMIVNSSRTATDRSIVRSSNVEDLSRKSIAAYRNIHRVTRPESDWNELDDESFLRILGAIAYDGEILRPTLAGLLMFGYKYTISFETNGYCLDYREYEDDPIDWIDRFMSDEDGWSGNLFDFYTECCRRVRRTMKHGMTIDENMRRIDDGDMDKVFREALLNAISNADYRSSGGVVVERRPNIISVRNPGTFRIPLDKAEAGGTSDPRNPTILKMFNLIGFGERAGSGISRMSRLCIKNGMPQPRYREQTRPDCVNVTIAIADTEGYLDLEEAILGMIDGDPRISITSMSENLGIDRNVASRTVQKLKTRGLIERVGGTRGYWSIPAHRNRLEQEAGYPNRCAKWIRHQKRQRMSKMWKGWRHSNGDDACFKVDAASVDYSSVVDQGVHQRVVVQNRSSSQISIRGNRLLIEDVGLRIMVLDVVEHVSISICLIEFDTDRILDAPGSGRLRRCPGILFGGIDRVCNRVLLGIFLGIAFIIDVAGSQILSLLDGLRRTADAIVRLGHFTRILEGYPVNVTPSGYFVFHYRTCAKIRNLDRLPLSVQRLGSLDVGAYGGRGEILLSGSILLGVPRDENLEIGFIVETARGHFDRCPEFGFQIGHLAVTAVGIERNNEIAGFILIAI